MESGRPDTDGLDLDPDTEYVRPVLEVDPGITSGDYLQGFLLGTREALSDSGRDSIAITVEDDGVGADPDMLRACLNGDPEAKDHIGLFNVDERLRSIFGPTYGLVIETAKGSGTKVTLRAPKYRPGVRAS